jgi:hypothetical protein
LKAHLKYESTKLCFLVKVLYINVLPVTRSRKMDGIASRSHQSPLTAEAGAAGWLEVWAKEAFLPISAVCAIVADAGSRCFGPAGGLARKVAALTLPVARSALHPLLLGACRCET